MLRSVGRQLGMPLATALALLPAPALACDWGYTTLPELFDASTDVFVGTVVESPFVPGAAGRTELSSSGLAGHAEIRMSVRTRYRGAPRDEMTLGGNSDCSFPFVQGETYLVHGVVRDGRLFTGSPYRPMTVPVDAGPAVREQAARAPGQWDATLALAYAGARAAGRPHAFVYGSLMFLDRAGGGQPPLDDDVITIRAEGDDDGFVTATRAPNTPWNMYEMLVPPGRYRFRVVRNGVQAGDVVVLEVANGESRRLNLGSGWKSPSSVAVPSRTRSSIRE